MSDKPVAHTEDLGNMEYDGNRRARAVQPAEAVPIAEKPTTAPGIVANEVPDVGLAQKGTDEAAIAQKETEI